MHGIWKAIGSFVRRADMILLSLCIAASVYGIVVISSATNVNIIFDSVTMDRRYGSDQNMTVEGLYNVAQSFWEIGCL